MGDFFGDLLVSGDDHVSGVRVDDLFHGDPADDPVDERFDDLAVLDDGRDDDPLERSTIAFINDNLLGHIDKLARQIAGVGRLQGRIRQSLARAVSGEEVLEDVQAFPQVGNDRGFDDLAGGLRHQAAHSGQLPDLLLVAAGPGIGHDK